ncbi:MATE family efflux transporter [Granulicella sp. 5B5]|uniref:MATE family efflux transporter n=1 Tax=Granulicella sp. 5B5 TaxID=1617967 RepID=UPI0021069D07|nr:MATE family efflux transporter [Granulicella sp. 5B5]
MSLVDTIMLGRLPNSALAMASAALAQVLFNTLCFGVGGVLLGLDTLISQALGAREQTQANRWLLHGLVMAVALSAVLLALFGFGPGLMRLMPVDKQILNVAIPAMQGLNYGTLPLLLYFTLRRYLQATNHGRPIAIALISANLVNAAGDWLLIFGHRWTLLGHVFAVPAFGVVGSSWSTSFARFYLMVVLAVAMWWLDRKHQYGLRGVSRTIELQHLRRLFLLGAPAGASIFVEIGIFALVTSLIASFGSHALAGHEVALQCASTTFMVPFAISSATSVRVGHAIGRMRTGAATVANAAAAGWSGIGAGAAFMLAASLVMLTMPEHIARIFTPDKGVIAAAVPLLVIASGFQFFDGIQINATGALRGAGNTTTGLLTQLVCYWVIGMPLGYLLGFKMHMGAAGLWWGLLIALTGAAIVLGTAWHRTLRTL